MALCDHDNFLTCRYTTIVYKTVRSPVFPQLLATWILIIRTSYVVVSNASVQMPASFAVVEPSPTLLDAIS